jgi:hypothetical protein
MSERRLGRLTEWLRRRPSSLEFWELFVTSERLIWCFVGETFSSALLRADMGERDRATLDDCTIEEVVAYNERNFTVPVSALETLRLTRGTRLRRATLEIAWREDGEHRSRTLYNTKAGDDQAGLFERLADEPALADVDVTVESPSSWFRR